MPENMCLCMCVSIFGWRDVLDYVQRRKRSEFRLQALISPAYMWEMNNLNMLIKVVVKRMDRNGSYIQGGI